jgi:hypothetical protein
MTHETPRERDPLVRYLGWFLMVAAVLWTVSAGLCTAYVFSIPANANDDGMRIVFGAIGSVTTLAGVGAFILGRWLARN